MFAIHTGSVYYMAPEVSPMRSSLFGYGLSADLWSAGVCAYAMLAAEFPFSAATDGELLLGLSQGPELVLDAPPWARVSPQCRDLVARLLRPTAQLRPTAAAALRHDWCALRCWQSRQEMTMLSCADATRCTGLQSRRRPRPLQPR